MALRGIGACIVIFCSFLTIGTAYSLSTMDILETKKMVIIHPKSGCEKTDTCDLKKVEFREYFYRFPKEVADESDTFGRELYAAYETDSVGDLPRYGFVQFIRGCFFISSKTNDGLEQLRVVAREHIGKLTDFRHVDWVVDSLGTDPFYSAETGYENRHYFFRWDKVRGSFRPDIKDVKVYYGEGLPLYPEMYVIDIPSGVYAGKTPYTSRDFARNVSLDFRMCLYKTKDIPKDITKETITAQPIACYEWSYHMIYNRQTQSFDRPDELHAFCKK